MNNGTRPPVNPASAAETRDDTVLDWARGAGAAELLVGGVDRYLQRRRRRRIALAATAGLAVLIASTGAFWLPWRGTPTPASVSNAFAGASILRPEQRTLPDGSTIELNAGAEIEVSFTEGLRSVVLRRGEAHFQVAKDAQRPFVVRAGAVEVRAVGTAFAVDLGANAVDVLVTEGRVAVNSDAPTASTPTLAAVDAGKRVVIDREASPTRSVAARMSEPSSADMQARLAWRVPRLKFAATPLAQVVAMFNEHAVAGRDARVVLAPDTPVNLRVSGTLRSDDVESLLRLLAGEFGISAEARAGEIVLRRK